MKLNVINVISGYGMNTREPYVQIMGDSIKGQLQIDPNSARELAHNLVQAAEAAEQDAFLFEFVEKELGQDTSIAAGIVLQFRQWRFDRGMNK